MKKDRFILLVLMLTVFLWPACQMKKAAVADGPGMSWKGNMSSQKEPFIKVVQAPDDWHELWKRAFDQPAPAVDFGKYVAACVFLGHSADWLYAIHIGHPFRRGDSWVIPYGLVEMVLELAGPFKARGQYAIQIIEKKKDAPMMLEEIDPSGKRK
jgi:hypothetical protein